MRDHVAGMDRHPPPLLDMTPDGRVRPAGLPLSARILVGAALIAIIAGGLAFAALALSVAVFLIPVALVAAAIAWATLRWRRWRAGSRGDGGSFGW